MQSNYAMYKNIILNKCNKIDTHKSDIKPSIAIGITQISGQISTKKAETKKRNILLPINNNDVINIKYYDEMPTTAQSNIIITLTTVPNRLMTPNFINTITSLCNQILKPKYIILHVCSKYNKEYGLSDDEILKKITEIQKMFPSLIIIRPPDMGPATKLLGLLYIDSSLYKIDDDDKIIIVDDDCPMKNNMTLHYEICYQLYNCDCIFINEQITTKIGNPDDFIICALNRSDIYYNNYKTYAYGWLSFSIKKRYVNNDMISLLDEYIKKDKRIMYHDDLFFSLYYKTKNLYACGINLILNCFTKDIVKTITTTGLHTETGARKMRYELESKFSLNKNLSQGLISRQKDLKECNLLKNVDDIKYDKTSNLDIRYFNDNIIIITILHTNLTTRTNTFKITDGYDIQLQNNCFSNKQSYFLAKTVFDEI